MKISLKTVLYNNLFIFTLLNYCINFSYAVRPSSSASSSSQEPALVTIPQVIRDTQLQTSQGQVINVAQTTATEFQTINQKVIQQVMLHLSQPQNGIFSDITAKFEQQGQRQPFYQTISNLIIDITEPQITGICKIPACNGTALLAKTGQLNILDMLFNTYLADSLVYFFWTEGPLWGRRLVPHALISDKIKTVGQLSLSGLFEIMQILYGWYG